MERWLVISNCQTQGLADCLSLQAEDISIVACDILEYRRECGGVRADILEFDKIVINPEFLESDFDVEAIGEKLISVPGIMFRAFHPDECLIYSGDAPFHSSIGVYHSVIAYAGFTRELSVSDTCALFNGDIYARLGYQDTWDYWNSYLTGLFDEHGLDISPFVRRWCRGAAFMHTSHHPKIECLYDVATVILQTNGRRARVSQFRPPDHLVADTCFPVYPEIASQLGFEGAYLFKPRNSFNCLGLEQFVAASFEVYRAHRADDLVLEDDRRAAFDALVAIL